MTTQLNSQSGHGHAAVSKKSPTVELFPDPLDFFSATSSTSPSPASSSSSSSSSSPSSPSSLHSPSFSTGGEKENIFRHNSPELDFFAGGAALPTSGATSASTNGSASKPKSPSSEIPTTGEYDKDLGMTNLKLSDRAKNNQGTKEGKWTENRWVAANCKTPQFECRYAQDRVTNKMDYCKRKHRPSLSPSDWTRYNAKDQFDVLKDKYLEIATKAEADYKRRSPGSSAKTLISSLDRIHCKDFTADRFREAYERPYKPCIIQGLLDEWPAKTEWQLHNLANGELRNCRLKCGEDDDGYSVKVRLKYFLQYQHTQQDDSPMYMFDSSYDENPIGKVTLLQHYSVPEYFQDDLFKLVGEKRRPPYRWWLAGPKRSGSNVHIDPLATSAWNALLVGRKLWVLFEPQQPKKQVKGSYHKRKSEDNEAYTYFKYILPRILKEEREKPDGPTLGMRMIVQYPGETIFVPGGWWHAVLNIDDTCAVTQNFASRINFPHVWKQTRKGRKHMARRWLEQLHTHYPELGAMAEQVNMEDDFEFDFSEKKKKKKKDKKKKKGKDKKRDRSDSEDSEKSKSSKSSKSSKKRKRSSSSSS